MSEAGKQSYAVNRFSFPSKHTDNGSPALLIDDPIFESWNFKSVFEPQVEYEFQMKTE